MAQFFIDGGSNTMRKTTLAFFFLGLMLFVSPLVSGQEQNGTEPEKKEKKYMIGFQIPIFDVVYEETINTYIAPGGASNPAHSYDLSMDLTVAPTANMILGFKVLERWWLMAVFGFRLHFDGMMESSVHTGLGIRRDFPFRNGVGFCGLFFEYTYQHFPLEDPSTTHGINLLGFGGAEYLATDFFGIGAQVQLGYLWYKLAMDESVTDTEGGWDDPYAQGMIFALLASMSFYF